MPSMQVPLPLIERAVKDVCQVHAQSPRFAVPWRDMSESDLWREMVACILGSRVPFQVANAAVERMDKANLFSETRRSSGYARYERDIRTTLLGSCKAGKNAASLPHPFAALRARQVRMSVEALRTQDRTIRSLLSGAQDVRDARRCLASEIPGIGPKQASLFLRNIGYATHIAVLDIHVLTYMHWMGLTPGPMNAVRTVPQYELLEDVFIEHAHSFGYPPDRFDIAVWVVVRVLKKEFRACR